MTTFVVNVANDPGTSSTGATSPNTLSWALAQANATFGPHTIEIQVDVELSGPLSPIFNSVTINGNGHTIDANGLTRIFMVGVDLATMIDPDMDGSIIEQRPQVAINDLVLMDGLAQGGTGGSTSGGGGMGAGGALFVNQSADVTLTNVSFADNSAVGGSGGTDLGTENFSGGGGGMAGNGGLWAGGGVFGAGGISNTASNGHFGAGGGFFGNGGSIGGGGYSGAGASDPGDFSGSYDGENGALLIAGLIGEGGDGRADRGEGGADGGGGGGNNSQLANSAPGGGGGFGGGDVDNSEMGGSGGFGGGGGSGSSNYASHGGDGGFGGGGGGGGGSGGDGGFGGGGGFGYDFGGGAGGYGGGGGAGANGGFGGGGGGNASGGFGGGYGGPDHSPFAFSTGGGGGAGLGGAVYVVAGGNLTINGGGAASGGSASGGGGGSGGMGAGTSGSAFGAGFFVQGSTVTFGGSGSYTISDVIADQNGSGGTLAADGLGGTGGASGITRTGTGTLILSGVNTYTGDTTVNGGLLRVDGSIAGSATTVNDGGTLGGTGTTGAVTVHSGGTLAAGASPGVLHTGNLVLDAGAIFEEEIGGAGPATTPGTGYDQVVVTGTVALGGAVLSTSLVNGFAPTIGATFEIIDNDGMADAVSGTFAGLAEGASFAHGSSSYSISYVGGDGNDVVLTALYDAAAVSASAGTTAASEQVAVVVDSGVTMSNADNAILASATVSITGGFQRGQDVLAFTNAGSATYGNIAASFNSLTGVLTLTSSGETATLAQWQSALRAVTYTDTSDAPDTAARTISFQANDSSIGGAISIKTVSVAAVNDAPSFAAGTGTVVTEVGSSYDVGRSVQVQPDGKILVAGESNNDFALVRYNTNGSLDTTFGSGGKVVTPIGSYSDTGQSIQVQPDGRIVMAGFILTGGGRDFALLRYNADGSLDPTFGSGTGKVVTPVGAQDDTGRSVELQPDGKIVVAGYTNNEFALTRYNADGLLDTTFNGSGKVVTSVGSNSGGYSVQVQPDGKIVVAGESNGDFALVRYNANGLLDATFGSGGKVVTAVGPSFDQGYSVQLQPDGKIVVAGSSLIGSSDDFALVRYDTNGSLDTTFGGTGKVTTSFGSFRDIGQSVQIQPDGKIVVAGHSSSGLNSHFALARYKVDGTLDTTFNGTGKVVTSIGSTAEAYSVQLQPDGKIVVTGYSTNGSNRDFALVRYNADGSLDTRFNLANTLDGAPSFTEDGAPVVLDANVAIYDAEMHAAGSYNGASLTLARHNGASAEDIYSAKVGSGLSALAEGGNLVLSGVTIGTVTQNSAGTLILTFNADATEARVNAAMQAVAYANVSDTPSASVQIDWSFSDGNSGAQGNGGAHAAIGWTTVAITAVNDAPTSGSVVLIAIAEDSGARVITQAELLAGASDPEGQSLLATGLVIAAGGKGTLHDNGDTTWSYTPASDDDTAVSFAYLISDGVVPAVAGSATLDITPVNDAPAGAVVALVAIAEDSGVRLITQAELLRGISDPDGPPAVASGLVISGGSGTLTDNHDTTWSYTPASNDDTSVSFSYQISDGVAPAIAASVTLEITPVYDAPTVVTLAAIAEDSGALLIRQVDLAGGSSVASALTISSGLGTLTDNHNGTWSFAPAANDDTSVAFAFLISDGVTPAVAASATLEITPVNDAPVNTMPGSLNTKPYTDLSISGLAVADPDAVSLTTTLHVEHGTLNVAAQGGANVTGSGTSTVTLTGSAAAINATLGAADNVLYHSAFHFGSLDHLTMTSRDGSGGGSLSDTDILDLRVMQQIPEYTVNGMTRPALYQDASGHIILDQPAADFASAYGTKALYLGVPASTPFPPVAAHDYHLL